MWFSVVIEGGYEPIECASIKISLLIGRDMFGVFVTLLRSSEAHWAAVSIGCPSSRAVSDDAVYLVSDFLRQSSFEDGVAEDMHFCLRNKGKVYSKPIVKRFSESILNSNREGRILLTERGC